MYVKFHSHPSIIDATLTIQESLFPFGDSTDSFTSTAGGWVVGSGTPTIAD